MIPKQARACLKAEASGYPNWVRRPEDENRYIQNFDVSGSILLDKDAIRPNATKRALVGVTKFNMGQTD
jgi:hypothetical protein